MNSKVAHKMSSAFSTALNVHSAYIDYFVDARDNLGVKIPDNFCANVRFSVLRVSSNVFYVSKTKTDIYTDSQSQQIGLDYIKILEPNIDRLAERINELLEVINPQFDDRDRDGGRITSMSRGALLNGEFLPRIDGKGYDFNLSVHMGNLKNIEVKTIKTQKTKPLIDEELQF